MYDYYLGGTQNRAVDRGAARQVLAMRPELVDLSKVNRAFLGRVVRFLTDAGIRQFIDIGAGLPTQENVHQVAKRIGPDTRVGLQARTSSTTAPISTTTRNVFDPDRWDPALHPALPRTAFLPFTNGARKCIGDRFSLIEGTLAANWRCTHLPGETVRPAASFAMKPHRLRMRATRRV